MRACPTCGQFRSAWRRLRPAASRRPACGVCPAAFARRCLGCGAWAAVPGLRCLGCGAWAAVRRLAAPGLRRLLAARWCGIARVGLAAPAAGRRRCTCRRHNAARPGTPAPPGAVLPVWRAQVIRFTPSPGAVLPRGQMSRLPVGPAARCRHAGRCRGAVGACVLPRRFPSARLTSWRCPLVSPLAQPLTCLAVKLG